MRSRLDKALTETGLVESRQRAQALVMAGSIRVNGVVERRPELGDPAFMQDGDLGREAQRLLDVVGDEDDRLLCRGVDARELALQGIAGYRVDRAERLVHQ